MRLGQPAISNLTKLAVLILLLPAAARAQGQIEGQVMNGTTQRPVGNQKVLVLVPREGMQQVADVTTDASGHFTVAQSGIDPASFYLLQANFQGVPYHAPAQFDSTGKATVDLTVYGATSDPASIGVSSLRILVAAQGQKLRVQEEYAVENSSKPGRTFASDAGTFVFHAPPDAGEPKVSVTGLMNMPIPLTPEKGKLPGEFKIRYALKPGNTPITVTYDADYTGASFTVGDHAAFPVDHVELFVFPSSLKVESAIFKPAGVDAANDIQKFESDKLPRGSAIEAQLSGEAVPNPQAQGKAPSEGDVKPVPNNMTRLGVPLFVCLLLILLWALGVRVSKEWNRWKDRQATSPAQKQLEARADKLFNALADLDELFAAGKIEKKQYWKERLELKAKLIAILKKGPPSHSEPYATRNDSR
jgi:hypothetical protein